ncbi:hypothetical protein GCM10014719_02270 [Planomonospora parontospora subsp. antibiotica]|nr:hypothetical protein GCM10014719_02270 [Planomonospora parontospora subsp. antibiotica]GII13387.1 hypothetical protein Ppa05_01130 [Planomonospora parontospora subsp. antibiotica]
MRRRLAISALAAFVTAVFAVSVNATAAGADSSPSRQGEIRIQLSPLNNAE